MLARGDRLAEFRLTEALPSAELRLDDPLNTIWIGDEPWNYDTVDTTNPEVMLTIRSGNSSTEKFAVLDLIGCGEPSFMITHDAASEGSISFTQTEALADEQCELTRNQMLSLEAMTRADYFVVAPWGVQLWDGSQALAVFANEEE